MPLEGGSRRLGPWSNSWTPWIISVVSQVWSSLWSSHSRIGVGSDRWAITRQRSVTGVTVSVEVGLIWLSATAVALLSRTVWT